MIVPTIHGSRLRRPPVFATAGAAGALVCALLGAGGGVDPLAEPVTPLKPDPARGISPPLPVLVRWQGWERLSTYGGKEFDAPTFEHWRPICGTAPKAVPAWFLEQCVLDHEASFEDGGIEIDGSHSLVGPDFVFAVSGTVPAGATAAIAAVESYLETLFRDPVSVRVSISFAALPAGVLGSTGTSYVGATYGTSRGELVTRRDPTDGLLPRLPTTSSVPVRYDGASDSVTQETRVFFTRAAFKSTVGSAAGNDGSIRISTTFPFDYDPSDGVVGFSFRDVLVHEVGHALGFGSGADFLVNDLTVMDLFRFQTTDGTGDFNPDSVTEFAARPRLVANNSPDDAHHLDLMSVEYRMSDGSPFQASHLREQTPSLGLMDPALGPGTSRAPNYFGARDLAVFDLIGWDR